ncbi:hypothetical protein ABBQ38_013974 [Trebouxia sp. C0009 RCD-2024]
MSVMCLWQICKAMMLAWLKEPVQTYACLVYTAASRRFTLWQSWMKTAHGALHVANRVKHTRIGLVHSTQHEACTVMRLHGNWNWSCV